MRPFMLGTLVWVSGAMVSPAHPSARLGPVSISIVPPPQPRIPRSVAMLPVRIALYAALTTVVYPTTLALATGRAIIQRVTKGTPAQILPTGARYPVAGTGAGYGGQMYFSQRIDIPRLSAALQSMAHDAGIEPEKAVMVSAGAPKGGCVGSFAWDSVVDGPGGAGTGWLEGWDQGYSVQLRVCNAPEDEVQTESEYNDGSPPLSVIQFNLPALAWDGSSCFNFMKELIHRYCGGAPNDVFRGDDIRLSPKAATSLDGDLLAFPAYLARLPLAILRNTHSFLWTGACTAPAVFGGPGLGLKGQVLNLSPLESRRLAAGLKARGASPFAGLTYAAVSGYRAALGRHPGGIVQQASLVTTAFEPVVPERNLIGDWLVGPVQGLPTDSGTPYSLEQAQNGYQKLLREIRDCDGAVREAFEAKAYGVINGGAATFQAPPTYPVGGRATMLDSVFFNNYGTRTIHPDAGCIGWNWGAPFQLGCNCIYVNGRTCICFA